MHMAICASQECKALPTLAAGQPVYTDHRPAAVSHQAMVILAIARAELSTARLLGTDGKPGQRLVSGQLPDLLKLRRLLQDVFCKLLAATQ